MQGSQDSHEERELADILKRLNHRGGNSPAPSRLDAPSVDDRVTRVASTRAEMIAPSSAGPSVRRTSLRGQAASDHADHAVSTLSRRRSEDEHSPSASNQGMPISARRLRSRERAASISPERFPAIENDAAVPTTPVAAAPRTTPRSAQRAALSDCTNGQTPVQPRRIPVTPPSPFGEEGAGALLDLSRGPVVQGAQGRTHARTRESAQERAGDAAPGARLASAPAETWGAKRRRDAATPPRRPPTAPPLERTRSRTRSRARPRTQPAGVTATSPIRTPRSQSASLQGGVGPGHDAATSLRDRVRESLLRTATLSDRDAPSVAPRVDALTAGQMGTPLGAFVALLAENTLARIAAMDAALANLTELRASAPTDPTAAMLGPAYDNMAAVLERERQLLHATLETVDSMAAAVAHAHSPSGGRRAPVPDGSAQPSAPGMQAVREAVQAFSDRSRELARAMASDDGTAAAPADPVTLPPLSLPSSLPLPSLPLHSPLGALPAPSFAVSLPAFASLTPATGPAGRSAPSHDGSATHHWLPASHLPGPAPVAPASLEEGLRKRLSFGLSPSPFDAAGKGHATAPDREVPFGAIADEIRASGGRVYQALRQRSMGSQEP